MGTGQGKLPQELVTDNALLKRKYESEELGGAWPVLSTPSDEEIGFSGGEYLFPFAHIKPGGSISAAVAAGYKTIFLDPDGTYICDDVVLPARTTIIGRNAQVSPSDSTHACFLLIDGSDDVNITDVKLVGQAASPNNTPYAAAHWAIKISRAARPRVSGCHVKHFSGGGVGAVGLNGRTDYAAHITGNTFERCFFGGLFTAWYEYGQWDNIVDSCRVGLMCESGNWTVRGKHTKCRTPYLSAKRAVDFSAGGVVAAVGNSEHGTISGLECNHANDSGASVWSSNSGIPLVGGGTYDAIPGVVFDEVLPPTMSGITLYYSDLTVLNRPVMATPSYFVGGSAAGCTISSDALGTLELVGVTVYANVTFSKVRIAGVTALQKVGLYSVGFDGYVGSGDPTDPSNGFSFWQGNATVTGNAPLPGSLANDVYATWTGNAGGDGCLWAKEIQVCDNSTTINGKAGVDCDPMLWKIITERGGKVLIRFRSLLASAPGTAKNNYIGFHTDAGAAYFGNAVTAAIGHIFQMATAADGAVTLKAGAGSGATVGTLPALDTAWHDLVVTIAPRSLTASAQLDAQPDVPVTLATTAFNPSGDLGNRIGWMCGSVGGTAYPIAFSKLLGIANQ